MARIWRNRVEAGTKKLANCPMKYRADVIELIREDLANGDYTEQQLQQLVESGMMTQEEYVEILGAD